MITNFQTKTGHLLPAIYFGNEYRFLGRTFNPLASRRFNRFSSYLKATSNPVVNLSTLPAYDRFQSNIPILDQNGNGSCVAHGHCSMVMKARDLQGLTYVPLSADSLYAQINHNQDQGSDPADAINALQTNGICLLSDVPDTFVYWDNISDSAKQNALRFKIPSISVYQCDSFEELVTADYLGFATTLTINVGNDFNNLSSEGVVPVAYGMANHCTSGGEGFKRLSDGTPAYRFRNSWTTQWGVNGCGWCTPDHFAQQPHAEMFALMWTYEDNSSNNDHLPPLMS